MKSKEMERIMSTIDISTNMLQEKGQRPTGPDDIMVKVFETIHKAALDAGRVVIAEPRSPMLDVSDWDVEVQVVKD